MALASNQAQVHAALQQAYNDLRQSQQSVMQQERLRALGQMASGIAHDINNAISPVALYTEMMLGMETNLSPRMQSYLETTKRAIEDVAHTVSRMREFYRKQEPALSLAPVDPQPVGSASDRFHKGPLERHAATTWNVHRAADGNAFPPPRIAGIESEIREALINLISMPWMQCRRTVS